MGCCGSSNKPNVKEVDKMPTPVEEKKAPVDKQARDQKSQPPKKDSILESKVNANSSNGQKNQNQKKTASSTNSKVPFEGYLNPLGGNQRHANKHFKGFLVNDLPEGQGTLVLEDNLTYVGEFSKGKMHGEGYLITEDGIKHSVVFENGKLATDIDFEVPDYLLKNPKVKKESFMIERRRLRYKGDHPDKLDEIRYDVMVVDMTLFKYPIESKSSFMEASKSQLNSETTRSEIDGSIFIGEVYKENGFPKNGKLTWPDGEVYEGEFFKEHNGRLKRGRIDWANGDVSEGLFFESNKRLKWGRIIWEDGDIYEGLFYESRNGRIYRGKKIKSNGHIYEGIFYEDSGRLNRGIKKCPNKKIEYYYDGVNQSKH